MIALLIVAVSVGLDNLGASTALGVSGVDRRARVRVALIFGVFEAAMPLLGLVIGHSVARDLGVVSKPLGGALLGLAGLYVIVSELRGDPGTPGPGLKPLILIAIALSIDNLIVGFALGTYRVNLAVAALTFATVSVALSLLGLEIGKRVGNRIGKRGELLGGAALILVGIAIGTGLL